MKVSRNLVLSLEMLAAHKLRTALSVLGIVIGVGAVVVMVSVGRGAENRIRSRIHDMGVNLIAVSAGQTRIIAGRKRQIATVTTLTPADAAAIERSCPSVALAAPAMNKRLAARYEAQTTNTNVVGATSEVFLVRNMTIASGRTFDAEEERARRRVAVLGPTAARNLFGDADPAGLQFRIGRAPFEVIGVTGPKGVDANGIDQDDLIVVPLRTAMRRLLNVTHVDSVYVQARSTEALGAAEQEIRELLRERHRLRNRPDDFTIQNQATLLSTEREMTRSMTHLIGSVAGISLFVGGVGILAVMLIAVRERTREIGLRRAVGARRRDIRTQFLIEAGILAGVGGLIGVIGGVALAMSVNAVTSWQAAISWPTAAIAALFSVGIGIVSGIYPATQAAALEPIEALRAE